MRRRALVTAAMALLLSGAIASACADDETPAASAPPDPIVLPTGDASPDAEADAGDVDAGVTPPIDCYKTDFCQVATLPNGISLNAIWGSSASDLWAVGTNGTILHGDGTTFTYLPSGTTVALYGVWGTGPNDVWVVASQAPLHADLLADGGRTWTSMTGTTWSSGLANDGRTWTIWGSSANDVRMAGMPSSRFGGSGSFWTKGPSPDGGFAWNAIEADEGDFSVNTEIRALWGTGPNDGWGAGANGRVFRFEPATGDASARWAAQNSGTLQTLEALWGSSASDVWAVGQEGVIRHLASATASDFDVFESPTSHALHAVWGSGPNDVWAVGDHATLAHYDGKAWTLADPGLPVGATPDLFGIWGSGPDDVWIVGDGLVLHRTKNSRRTP